MTGNEIELALRDIVIAAQSTPLDTTKVERLIREFKQRLAGDSRLCPSCGCDEGDVHQLSCAVLARELALQDEMACSPTAN